MGNNLLCGLNWLGKGTYTAEGIIAIAEMLKVNTALQSIGCASRARFLTKCQQPLTPLCLTLVRSVRGNHIGREGAMAFREALKTNSTLEVLGYVLSPLMTDLINCQQPPL